MSSLSAAVLPAVQPPTILLATDDEIFAYYRAISEAVSIPIMLYNNPFTSNIDMSAGLVARMTKAFDNVRYIKEASMDVGRIFDIIEATDNVMNVFAGNRPVESFMLGAVGYVNPFGNYIPYSTARLWDFLVEGRIDDAKHVQQLAGQIYSIIVKDHPTYGHQCYSKALAESAGYPVGDVRSPLTQFRQLGAEGIARRDEIIPLMQEVESFAANRQRKARSG